MSQVALLFITLFTGMTINTPSPTNAVSIVNPPTEEVTNTIAFRAIDSTDWVKGASNAPVTIIEWMDYECVFCKNHTVTTAKILDEYNGKVNLIYRHYPLYLHENSHASAEAAECAGHIGGNESFWEYSALLFNQGTNQDAFVDYAERIGLNSVDFNNCYFDYTHTERVLEDGTDGKLAGVTGTPTSIIINNTTGQYVVINGSVPYADFEQSIKEVLAY